MRRKSKKKNNPILMVGNPISSLHKRLKEIAQRKERKELTESEHRLEDIKIREEVATLNPFFRPYKIGDETYRIVVLEDDGALINIQQKGKKTRRFFIHPRDFPTAAVAYQKSTVDSAFIIILETGAGYSPEFIAEGLQKDDDFNILFRVASVEPPDVLVLTSRFFLPTPEVQTLSLRILQEGFGGKITISHYVLPKSDRIFKQ